MNAKAKLQCIAVLVSTGRHAVSGTPRYSRNDAAALELGRKLAQRHGAQLDVIHAGDPADPALPDYLALGAQQVEVLPCTAADDAAHALAARVRDHDLVLTGTRAEGAYDSGMLPYRVAALLGRALVGAAVDLEVEDGNARVRQFLPKGLRRRVEAALPAVVAVHPLAEVQPAYAYARLRAGSVQRGSAGTHVPNADAAAWQSGPVTRKPVKFAAAERRSGHARMLGATTTESRGGNVVNAGSSVEKAQVILAYLREHQLIDY